MKRIIKIFACVLVVAFLVGTGIVFYKTYMDAQQTSDEMVEQEEQKIQLAYKENLDAAMNARKQYEYIVILNPAHGGKDYGYENSFGVEKNITLAICNQVIALNKDLKLGIFLTRTQDVEMDEQMRLAFIEKLQPDMFIDVHVNKSASSESFGTGVSYDTTYFNRKLSNAEFADIMEKNVVAAIEGKALGIVDITDKEDITILKNLKMPAISVNCGDMSHEMEGELLTRQEYQKNLAKGILDGIRIARTKVIQ